MIVEIDYTNYKGERRLRQIIPEKELTFQSTLHHEEQGWIVHGWDIAKRARRSFALKDIHSWSTV